MPPPSDFEYYHFSEISTKPQLLNLKLLDHDTGLDKS